MKRVRESERESRETERRQTHVQSVDDSEELQRQSWNEDSDEEGDASFDCLA